MVGGGSGGHVSPLLAVAHELKNIDPSCRLIYVGEKNGKFLRLAINSEYFDNIKTVRAGKFRRYHGESWFARITDFKTIFLNFRDIIYTLIGVFQSIYLLVKNKPKVVFIKGGFVGVPVGVACVILRTKFVTHDSDIVPGLANRIVSKWASWHAVGMPAENYEYDQNKIKFTGIPVPDNYTEINHRNKSDYRRQLSIPDNAHVVCVTGGSLGAFRMNTLVSPVLIEMLKENDKLYVIHQTGERSKELYANLSTKQKNNIIEADFFDDLYKYTGAADLVITRAGASTIASLALQKKPILIIPNPFLTGGHQLKNAKHLEESSAAVVILESQLETSNQLKKTILRILADTQYAKQLSDNLGKFAKPDAALDIANLLIKTAK